MAREFKFNIGDKVYYEHKNLILKDTDGVTKCFLKITPKIKITDRLYCDNEYYHGNYYQLENIGWVLESQLLLEVNIEEFEDFYHMPVVVQTVDTSVITSALTDEKMMKVSKPKLTKKEVEVIGDRIIIQGVEFNLVREGEKIETVNVEKYKQFYNSDKEEHEFDLEFPYDEEFSLKDYKPLTKDYIDNHLSVAAVEHDDCGTRYDTYTDYWYISLRKVEDMTEEQFDEFINSKILNNVVVIYDNENKLWIVETNED